MIYISNFVQQSSIDVTPAGGAATPTDNDYTRINNAVQYIADNGTITLNGTFNWTEPNAAASWAKGSDGQTGAGFTNDDYSVLPPANLNGVTFTAPSLGAATIQGPGDLPAVNLEGVFYFDGGDNQNWTISNMRFLDFDLSIGMFNGAGGSDAFNGTLIQNNFIRIPNDLNATVAPADTNQNIGIHYSFGTNQTISGNTIDTPGDGVSAAPNFSSVVGMQSNTSGSAVYDGLQITNNIINVLNAQDNANPQTVLGIWENAHAHSSDITVNGNQFLSVAAGNNPSVNLLRGFRVTSHSSATTTVAYSNNRVEGANIGFQWIASSNFAGNQPVRLTSNLIRNNATGVLVQSNGLANLSFNRIVGNSASGVENIAGSITTAENNWWGCNFGPGAGGAGCAGTANGTIGTVDADPWLTLRTSATPNAVSTGGTSSILSNLNFNSDNVDTSGSGSVPNGTPATFTATLGTVSPPNGTTTSGVTGTTFTAGAASGTGGAQTTIDGQTVNAPIAISFTCNNVSIPTGATAANNTQFLVPINIDDTTGRNILGYSFTLTYNPAVVTPVSLEMAGTLSNGWSSTTNNSPGTLNVVVFNPPGGFPLTGSGVLLNVKFVSSGGIGSTSTLSLSNFILNEGVPCVNTTGGDVTIISGTISGAVTYAIAPTTRPVPNTTITASGLTPPSPVVTDVNGLYSMGGFSTGPYTLTPSKTGQVNGIGNADATAVAQHIVGFITLNANQSLAADVTQNGTISSLDATYIAQYAALIPNPSFTGTWKFLPPNRSYPNVQTNQTNQDYSAILLGEVTGNWDNLILRPGDSKKTETDPTSLADKTAAIVAVNAPVNQFAAEFSAFTVDLSVSNTTGEGIFGYEFNLYYNENVILTQNTPCDSVGTVSAGRTVTCNSVTPGFIRVVVFSTTGTPISGAGTLLKLKFNAVGAPGNTSPLTIQNFIFNEGTPTDVTTDGQILIVGPSSAAVSIGGRLLTATGQPVVKATVLLTDTGGTIRTAISNGFGFYRFDDVSVGETYIVSVSSKRYTFTPMVISPTDDINELNLIAEP